MNKKIIEDLIKNSPDLYEKKLEEVISLLRQNNPEIKIDEKFKQNLKSRLDSIIEYNNENKKSFFGRLFLVPVFSVFLIIGGVFYIYKDITLLEQNNIKYENTQIIDDLKHIEEKSEEIIDYENKNFIINNFDKVNEMKTDEPKINKIKTGKTKINEQKKEDKKIDLNKRNTNEVKRNKVDIEITDKKIENDIEDNQIINILGEGSNDNNFDNNGEFILPEESNILEKDTMFYDNGNNEPYMNSFIEYCEEYSSEILIDENEIRYCIIEEKICMESDYSNNTCKLTQKK